MSYVGNSPAQATILRVEARKSFSLGIWIMDSRGRNVDISGCALTIVAKPKPLDVDSDATNFLAADATAVISAPELGYARFNLQAASLDQTPGEYDYAIVLRTPDNYTSVIVKGILDIQENTEYASVGVSYGSVNPSQSLSVMLRENNSVSVYIGAQLPPGMNYVRDSVMLALETFDPEAIALVPAGGTAGYALTKLSTGDYDMDWRPGAQGTLDATAQPAGRVPTAVGDDTWIWDNVGIDATAVTAGWAPVANGDDTWDWAEVSTATPDWNAAPAAPGEILNKPTLGTAAAAAATDFIDAATLVSAMPGVHFQTTIPVTGTNGHVYFVYEA